MEVWFLHSWSEQIRRGVTPHGLFGGRWKPKPLNFYEVKAISWIWHQKLHPIYDKFISTNDICICLGIDKQYEYILILKVMGTGLWRFLKRKFEDLMPWIELIHTPCMDTHFLRLKLFNPISQHPWESHSALFVPTESCVMFWREFCPEHRILCIEWWLYPRIYSFRNAFVWLNHPIRTDPGVMFNIQHRLLHGCINLSNFRPICKAALSSHYRTLNFVHTHRHTN